MSDAPAASDVQKLRPKLKRQLLALFLVVSCAAFVVWALIDEMHIILRQPVNAWLEDVNADCAVALTGGPNRVREGLDLLSRKAVQKLIISGVNPQVELRDIFPLRPYYGDLKDQDVILERRSRTTYGNAQQTLPLVEALHCRDLVLVTSRAHMYRALRTFRAEFPPEFPIHARAVVGSNEPPLLTEVVPEAIKSLFYSFWAY